jgi:hypothetical protein
MMADSSLPQIKIHFQIFKKVAGIKAVATEDGFYIPA